MSVSSPLDPTQWLKTQLLLLGFDDVGIAPAQEGTPYQSEFLDAILEKRHGPLDYLERTALERSDVLKLMPEAKSVVVVIKNYYTGDHGEVPEGFAKVSRYAWGGDYHHWFKKRLQKIRSLIHQNLDSGAKIHIFNDTGPVLERGWAEKTGLGFIGKSGLLIHRNYGTWTFIGGFVTDLSLRADKPTAKSLCGTCTACMDACPTRAILSPKKVDAGKCLTTWNVERPLLKEADKVEFKGSGWAVGCDICQEVCPWNKFEKITEEPRFQRREGHDLISIASIPKETAGTPLARPGQEGLLVSVQRAQKFLG